MSQNSRNKGFSYYFCLMTEGLRSVPLTNGSGSRRLKNIQIRIRNTAYKYLQNFFYWTAVLKIRGSGRIRLTPQKPQN
jgi:hypothetical protein